MRANTLEDFTLYIKYTENCWIWKGPTDKDGYGIFCCVRLTPDKRRHYKAHRVSFLIKHGRWPNTELLHSCDIPACVNPDHIREGTHSENIKEAYDRGLIKKAAPAGASWADVKTVEV